MSVKDSILEVRDVRLATRRQWRGRLPKQCMPRLRGVSAQYGLNDPRNCTTSIRDLGIQTYLLEHMRVGHISLEFKGMW